MIRLILGALFAALTLQIASGQDIEEIGIYVGASDALVHRTFGKPHAVTYLDEKDALVWTYFLQSNLVAPSPELGDLLVIDSVADSLSIFSLLPIAQEREGAGYVQFAFWNGKVAATSVLATGSEAESRYETSLAYLLKHAQWVGKGTSVSSRVARMGENLWSIHKKIEDAVPRSVLRVGDAGYLQCSRVRMSELQRVKAQFGVDLKTTQ